MEQPQTEKKILFGFAQVKWESRTAHTEGKTPAIVPGVEIIGQSGEK